MGCRLSVNRFDAIDGTRGILAGMVMLSHMFGSFMGWPQVRPFSGAYLCVVYFFIMSGFVLTYAHASGNFFKYVLTRFARLWPLHFLSTILMVAIYYYNAHHGGYVSSPDVFSISVILKNILFLHGLYWHDFKLVNEPSWSISIEFWVSLLIPLIFTRLGNMTRAVVAGLLFIFLWHKHPSGIPPSMLTAMLSMLIGSLFFSLSQTEYFKCLMKEKFMAFFITAAAIVSFVGVYAMNHSRLDYFLFVAFIPMLFIDHLPDNQLIKRVFTSNLFLFLGYISFPLYLLHELVIVSGFIFDPENTWVSISIAAFASIFIAYIYARFIDYPLYRALKRQIAKIS
ncbi:TPA: acyltransferase [Raoultella planticola]|nr:acyltransferase [Raoultella planticola]ELH7934275.1 acyltransferase [Raoultella planticola]HEJ8373616.1 acyltransferase [Raoultella planticola]HEJ9318521.1 acyltransferase [Raoultella planticola]HEM8829184.1 acyltransferase [Raoultella planticola]